MAEANLGLVKQLEAMRGSVGDDAFDAAVAAERVRHAGPADDADEVKAAAEARAAAGTAKGAVPVAKAGKTTRATV